MEPSNMIYKKNRVLICGLAYALLIGSSFSVVCASASENLQHSRFRTPVQPPHTRYSIEVTVDASKNRLKGREEIRIQNASIPPLKRLVIDWPYLSFEEMRILLEGKPVKVLEKGKSGLSSSQVLIELPHVNRSGEPITLEIQFGCPLRLGRINKLAGWYPRLWWGPNTSDDYEVKVNVPEEYVVATSGVFDETKDLYTAKGVRKFGIVLMRGLEILKAASGATEIYCYYEKTAETCAELIHETAIDVIDFYRDWLGFYPHKMLHIIPGGLSHPAGGYPVATAIVGIHGQKRMNEKPESHWRFITAHEIGHQYWMEHVLEAPETFWLMIGLGVYADRAFMLAKGYGDQHERDMIQRYVNGTRDMLDTRMNRLAEERKEVGFDYNNMVNHGKGFGVISALACMMGKSTFESAYRRCLEEFKGLPLGVADFQRVCEEESGERLDWFFDQWVRTSRFLSYEIASQETGKRNATYVTTAKVRRLGTLSMPVPVTTFFEDNSRQCLHTDRLLDECFLVFTSETPLKEIKLDVRGELPLVVPPPDPKSVQLKKDIRSLQWTGEGDKALQIYAQNRDGDLEDAGLLFKLGMCLYDGEYYKEALQIFRKCVDLGRDKRSDSLYSHLTWQGHVLDLLNRREEALPCYKEALEHCGSRYTRHDQYRMRTDRSWIEKRIESPFQRPDPTIIKMIEQINDLQLETDGDKALQLFNVVKNIKSDDYSIPWFKLGFCLYDGRHYEEAIQAFQNSFESSPKTTRSHLFGSLVWQGHLLDLMNRRKEALTLYRKALQYFDKYHPPGDWMKHSQHGMIIDRDWIEERLEIPFQRPDPEIVDLMVQVIHLQNTGEGDKALRLFEEATNIEPGHGFPWGKLGLCLYDGRHYKEALQAFQNCLDSSASTSPDVYYSLIWQGHLLDLMNRREEALECYEQALKHWDSGKIVLKITRYDQYGIRIDRDWIEARLKTPFHRD